MPVSQAQWMWADAAGSSRGAQCNFLRWSRRMPPEQLLAVLTDKVPFEMRSRPVRLRVGAEEVLCDTVDEAKLRLTRRPAARRDDWALVRDLQGKQVWVNLRAVLSEERALWAKERALSDAAPDLAPADFELLREGLRRRRYVPVERRLLEWSGSAMRTSHSTPSNLSSMATSASSADGGERQSRSRSRSQEPSATRST